MSFRTVGKPEDNQVDPQTAGLMRPLGNCRAQGKGLLFGFPRKETAIRG